MGAPAHVVGGAQEVHLLEAQVGSLHGLARLDDRPELAAGGGEVEILDPLARPVEGGAHRLQGGGEVFFLLRQDRRTRRLGGRRDQERQAERQGAAGGTGTAGPRLRAVHRNLRMVALLRPET